MGDIGVFRPDFRKFDIEALIAEPNGSSLDSRY